MHQSSLSPNILAQAYSEGFFPMPHEITGEIQWYRPDPRAIIDFEKFNVSRSLSRLIRKNHFQITYSKNFTEIMKLCSMREETWITQEFIDAYTKMHNMGAAQSVEVWQEGKIVGGVYGINLGGAFSLSQCSTA